MDVSILAQLFIIMGFIDLMCYVLVTWDEQTNVIHLCYVYQALDMYYYNNTTVVITVFNTDYITGNTTGKGRIPYGDLAKLGCVITGLPHGMDLKQPNQYSSSELRQLYDCIENIKFLEIPDFTDQEVVIEQEEIITSEHEQST